MEPKWTPKSQKTGADGLPEKQTQNYPYFFTFPLFSKTSMFQKHCKLQYRTMFFLEPSPAQHLQKNTKKQVENHSKILQKLCPEAFQNRSQKIYPKKHNKNRKNTENV
jgi:hypothetical protein